MKEDTRQKLQEASKKTGEAVESVAIAAAAGLEELSKESVKAAKQVKEVYDNRYADKVEPYRKAMTNAVREGFSAADDQIRKIIQENELDKKASKGAKELMDRLSGWFEKHDRT